MLILRNIFIVVIMLDKKIALTGQGPNGNSESYSFDVVSFAKGDHHECRLELQEVRINTDLISSFKFYIFTKLLG